MKGRQITYSAGELAWIHSNREMTRRELHAAFQVRFGRGEITADHIKALCTRKGWATGRTGRIEVGNVPMNKGKKCEPGKGGLHPNAKATHFKKSSRSGVAVKLYKPIGSERMSKDGYLERKVNDDMPLQARWRAVHVINWEAVNGPKPKGHALKCLDGNRSNTDASNWKLVPRGMLPRLAGRWTIPYDTAAPEVRPTIMAVAQLKHAAKSAKTRATRQT